MDVGPKTSVGVSETKVCVAAARRASHICITWGRQLE